jgi:hypothetical protein
LLAFADVQVEDRQGKEHALKAGEVTSKGGCPLPVASAGAAGSVRLVGLGLVGAAGVAGVAVGGDGLA